MQNINCRKNLDKNVNTSKILQKIPTADIFLPLLNKIFDKILKYWHFFLNFCHI